MPPSIAELKTQRSCACPRISYSAIKARPLEIEFDRVRAAANRNHRVVLAMTRTRYEGEPPAWQRVSRLYQSTLEMLRQEGLPTEPFLTLDAQEVIRLVLTDDDELILGLAGEGQLLVGPLGGSMELLQVESSSAAARQLELNPDPNAVEDVAIALEGSPPRLFMRGPEDWRLFDRLPPRSGTCVPPGNAGLQGDHLAWTAEGGQRAGRFLILHREQASALCFAKPKR